MSLKSWLDNWLKNFLNIHLLTHLPIGIPGDLIEVNVRLEIMPNSCPTVIAFLVFFTRLMYFFNVVLTITNACLPNNPKLILGTVAKMYLITETHPVPILLVETFLKHSCSLIQAIFCCFLIYPTFPTSNALMILHCTYCSLHYATWTL